MTAADTRGGDPIIERAERRYRAVRACLTRGGVGPGDVRYSREPPRAAGYCVQFYILLTNTQPHTCVHSNHSPSRGRASPHHRTQVGTPSPIVFVNRDDVQNAKAKPQHTISAHSPLCPAQRTRQRPDIELGDRLLALLPRDRLAQRASQRCLGLSPRPTPADRGAVALPGPRDECGEHRHDAERDEAELDLRSSARMVVCLRVYITCSVLFFVHISVCVASGTCIWMEVETFSPSAWPCSSHSSSGSSSSSSGINTVPAGVPLPDAAISPGSSARANRARNFVASICCGRHRFRAAPWAPLSISRRRCAARPACLLPLACAPPPPPHESTSSVPSPESRTNPRLQIPAAAVGAQQVPERGWQPTRILLVRLLSR